MKNLFAIMVVSLMAVGCAGTYGSGQQHTVYPCVEPLPKKDTSETFEVRAKAGISWFWNEATQAWEWISSEPNKERAHQAWEATKNAATEAYNKAVQEYNERK